MTEADEAPPMTTEQAAIMAHDELIHQLREEVRTLNAAVRTLAGDVRTLMKERTR